MGRAVTFSQKRNRNHNIDAKQTLHMSIRKDADVMAGLTFLLCSYMQEMCLVHKSEHLWEIPWRVLIWTLEEPVGL